MEIIKSWHLFEQDDNEPTPKAKKADIDPLNVIKVKSLVSKSKTANNIMSLANKLYDAGKYYDAFKKYKLAQQKDPGYFWAYYNAAASAYNAGTNKAIQLIPSELKNAKQALINWKDDQKTKDVAQKTYNGLIKNLRKHTKLNI